MEEGHYLVSRCAMEKKYFRQAEKTVLFLPHLGGDSNPKKDAGEPVWEYFLQQEADKKNIEQVE